jgi:cobalamin biosynthesis Mg chelatase CobN
VSDPNRRPGKSAEKQDSKPATPASKRAEQGRVKPPAARAAEAKAVAEAERRRQAQKATAPNPTWWVPVFVTLLLVGLLWIVTFYVTSGVWPIAAFGYWNLVIGFGILIVGFAMTMRWR